MYPEPTGQPSVEDKKVSGNNIGKTLLVIATIGTIAAGSYYVMIPRNDTLGSYPCDNSSSVELRHGVTKNSIEGDTHTIWLTHIQGKEDFPFSYNTGMPGENSLPLPVNSSIPTEVIHLPAGENDTYESLWNIFLSREISDEKYQAIASCIKNNSAAIDSDLSTTLQEEIPQYWSSKKKLGGVAHISNTDLYDKMHPFDNTFIKKHDPLDTTGYPDFIEIKNGILVDADGTGIGDVFAGSKLVEDNGEYFKKLVDKNGQNLVDALLRARSALGATSTHNTIPSTSSF